MRKATRRWLVTSVTAHGSILLFLVVALEVMIMISPFAFFFYSVFSPIFNLLDRYAVTAWLTAFFLPHMILPPTLLLQSIRVLGSAFFVLGALAFVVCALQVYAGKLFRWGIAQRGLYRTIRHPQYLALSLWGIGMAILWPRFMVLVTLSLMFVLYYYLAKDEERRMLSAHGESYDEYKARTGMFLPRSIERLLPSGPQALTSSPWKHLAVPLLTFAVVLGAGFLCREVTLRSLPFDAAGNVSLLSILPEDSQLDGTIAQAIAKAPDDSLLAFLDPDEDYIGYVMPPDYIMQGMIANTGSDFHLFKQHNTIAMITDWVLHPFGHLRRPPSMHMAAMHGADPALARRHHCPLGRDEQTLDCAHCPYRRVIFVQIDGIGGTGGVRRSGRATLSIGLKRVPVAFFDINTSTGEIIDSKPVEPLTAWAGVPTPAI